MFCVSDGSEDPETTPFLEIADQKGNPLKIPQDEKKVRLGSDIRTAQNQNRSEPVRTVHRFSAFWLEV